MNKSELVVLHRFKSAHNQYLEGIRVWQMLIIPSLMFTNWREERSLFDFSGEVSLGFLVFGIIYPLLYYSFFWYNEIVFYENGFVQLRTTMRSIWLKGPNDFVSNMNKAVKDEEATRYEVFTNKKKRFGLILQGYTDEELQIIRERLPKRSLRYS